MSYYLSLEYLRQSFKCRELFEINPLRIVNLLGEIHGIESDQWYFCNESQQYERITVPKVTGLRSFHTDRFIVQKYRHSK